MCTFLTLSPKAIALIKDYDSRGIATEFLGWQASSEWSLGLISVAKEQKRLYTTTLE